MYSEAQVKASSKREGSGCRWGGGPGGECQKDQRNSSKELQLTKSRAIRSSKYLSTVVDYSSLNNSRIYESILLTNVTKAGLLKNKKEF